MTSSKPSHCKNCEASLPAQPTEYGTECSHCLAIYTEAPLSRVASPISETLSFEQDAQSLKISHAWERPGSKVAVAFTLVWIAMLTLILSLGWSTISARLTSVLPTWAIGLPLLGLSACFAWALFALYSALAGWFNTTFITITKSSLQIGSRPLPVRPRLHVPFAVHDSFVRKVIVPMKKGEFTQFQVEAIFENGKTHPLVKELDSAEEAFAVDQAIQAFLRPSE